jgi:hypothetical protein
VVLNWKRPSFAPGLIRMKNNSIAHLQLSKIIQGREGWGGGLEGSKKLFCLFPGKNLFMKILPETIF